MRGFLLLDLMNFFFNVFTIAKDPKDRSKSFRDEGKQQEDFRATQHLVFSHIAILLREMFPDYPSISLQPGIKHDMNGDFPDNSLQFVYSFLIWLRNDYAISI
jgi:hypothetical protein